MTIKKKNAIGTKKFHQDYTLHKMDIPMTSCLLVLDMFSFLHARSEIFHSFDSYSSMYFTRHTLCIMHSITNVVYPGKPSFD
jgi:hypothetical protein